MLFGCPLWAVGEMVPASEMPIWRAHFEQEPWGFKALDQLASKSAFQIAQCSAALRPGTTYRDFMFTDRFESLELTEHEFSQLSDEEQSDYVKRQVLAAKRVLN